MGKFDWIKPFPGEGSDWKLDVKWFGSGVQLFGIVVIDTSPSARRRGKGTIVVRS